MDIKFKYVQVLINPFDRARRRREQLALVKENFNNRVLFSVMIAKITNEEVAKDAKLPLNKGGSVN